jgi:hypothetical protein
MPHRYAEIAFTPTVTKAQQERGSRNAYARMEGAREVRNHRPSEAAEFIAGRNSRKFRDNVGRRYIERMPRRPDALWK